MRSRQFVCNDPKVIELLDQFVPIVDTPANYSGYGVKVDRNTLQYRLVDRVLGQTVYRKIEGAQGLYIITPSGQLIAGTTEHSNPSRVLAEMRKGLEAYRRLPKPERLLEKAPSPSTDRIKVESDTAKPPEGGLVLRLVTRGLTESGFDREDTRHRFYYKLDRVWLTREQARSLVPMPIRTGSRSPIGRPALAIITRLHLGVFVQPNPAWNAEDVQSAELTSEITAVSGDVVELSLQGAARYAANNQFNQRRYDPKLIGRATYNSRRQQFESFTLVAVGTHTVGKTGEDQRVFGRGPQSIPLGVLFTLNGDNVNDQIPPEHLDQYPRVLRSAQ